MSRQVTLMAWRAVTGYIKHDSESNSTVTFPLNGSPIDYVTEFSFLGLTLDCNLNFKSHSKIIRTKISRVIGLLHKLKYIVPAYLLRMIYNSLILPPINYCSSSIARVQNVTGLSYCKKSCSSYQL